ncbi:hypothetical protein LY78DRAFT_664240 [Colletotrichum sublineola]|nr:hypothetical protein LY78DRAFT_664240 [Colletotrichum sublineola]
MTVMQAWALLIGPLSSSTFLYSALPRIAMVRWCLTPYHISKTSYRGCLDTYTGGFQQFAGETRNNASRSAENLPKTKPPRVAATCHKVCSTAYTQKLELEQDRDYNTYQVANSRQTPTPDQLIGL